jgi:hypothetical protein
VRETRNTDKIVEKLQEREHIWKYSYTLEVNIKIDHRIVRGDNVDRTQLAQDKMKWRTFVNKVLDLKYL